MSYYVFFVKKIVYYSNLKQHKIQLKKSIKTTYRYTKNHVISTSIHRHFPIL